jgi:hypothetical protein
MERAKTRWFSKALKDIKKRQKSWQEIKEESL